MHTTAKRLIVLAAGLVAAASFVVPRYFVAEASDPHGAYSSPDNTRVLWFIHASDVHIGASGSADSSRLQWLVTTARDVVNPSFIVATGDLVYLRRQRLLRAGAVVQARVEIHEAPAGADRRS